MLYQLSYLGMHGGPRPSEPAGYSGLRRLCPPVQASGNDGFFVPCIVSGSVVRLFHVVLAVLGTRDDVSAGKPTVEVDVAAARGTERTCRLGNRLAADRAGRRLAPGFGRLRGSRRH